MQMDYIYNSPTRSKHRTLRISELQRVMISTSTFRTGTRQSNYGLSTTDRELPRVYTI